MASELGVLASTFVVALLDALSIVQPNRPVSRPTSAKVDTAGLQGTFIVFKRSDDSRYRRWEGGLKVANFESGGTVVITKVNVSEDEDGAVIRLDAESARKLASRSFVDERADELRFNLVLRMPRVDGRRRSRTTPKLPFTITAACSIDVVREQSPAVYKGEEQFQLQRGDIVLGVNGALTRTGGDVRSVMRRAMVSDADVDIPLTIWRPPEGWVAKENNDARAAQAAPITSNDVGVPGYKDSEMTNMLRLAIRLEGGLNKKQNACSACGALGLDENGSTTILKRRIEHELRRRHFENDRKWLPTQEQIKRWLLGTEDDTSFPVQKIRDVVEYLRSLPDEIGE